MIRVDQADFEQRWGAIETRAPALFDLVDAGRVLDDPDVTADAKDLLALHLARSRTVVEVYRRSALAALDEMPQDPDLRHGPTLDELFLELTGLHPAGPGARLHVLDTVKDSVAARLAIGGEFFAERLDEHFHQHRSLLEGLCLEVGIAEEGEFVIGDAPAVPIDARAGKVGVLGGVPVAEANMIIMPVSPTRVLSVGPKPRLVDVPPDAVRRINTAQLFAAHQKVYFRPSDDLATEVRAIWTDLGGGAAIEP